MLFGYLILDTNHVHAIMLILNLAFHWQAAKEEDLLFRVNSNEAGTSQDESSEAGSVDLDIQSVQSETTSVDTTVSSPLLTTPQMATMVQVDHQVLYKLYHVSLNKWVYFKSRDFSGIPVRKMGPLWWEVGMAGEQLVAKGKPLEIMETYFGRNFLK